MEPIAVSGGYGSEFSFAASDGWQQPASGSTRRYHSAPRQSAYARHGAGAPVCSCSAAPGAVSAALCAQKEKLRQLESRLRRLQLQSGSGPPALSNRGNVASFLEDVAQRIDALGHRLQDLPQASSVRTPGAGASRPPPSPARAAHADEAAERSRSANRLFLRPWGGSPENSREALTGRQVPQSPCESHSAPNWPGQAEGAWRQLAATWQEVVNTPPAGASRRTRQHGARPSERWSESRVASGAGAPQEPLTPGAAGSGSVPCSQSLGVQRVSPTAPANAWPSERWSQSRIGSGAGAPQEPLTPGAAGSGSTPCSQSLGLQHLPPAAPANATSSPRVRSPRPGLTQETSALFAELGRKAPQPRDVVQPCNVTFTGTSTTTSTRAEPFSNAATMTSSTAVAAAPAEAAPLHGTSACDYAGSAEALARNAVPPGLAGSPSLHANPNEPVVAQAQVQTCPHCGKANPSAAAFCCHCGMKQGEEPRWAGPPRQLLATPVSSRFDMTSQWHSASQLGPEFHDLDADADWVK
eukprot:TRINITY_DN14443_c0_g1_i1.p1 TRINITY_DN14443_c0_g1~~TRINITY_DN14443_c0_g1_i1.p1  ORF type:complete len:534 (+),score=70.61 TRINITY_DN14443_c0_g1_i1:25-1602(+)